MKKTLAILCLTLLLSACGPPDVADTGGALPLASREEAELIIFADASATDALEEIAGRYRESAPWIRTRFHFASSGELSRRIRDGAECDLFLSAASAPMDALDGAFRGDLERNPEGLDMLLQSSRVNLAENRVVLAVPVGNPQGIRNFSHMSAIIRRNGGLLLATANPGDPLGAYAARILSYYYLDESVVTRGFTLAANSKEVVTRIRSGMADGGILYRTDADGLEIIDTAEASVCGRVLYCAAVLSGSARPLAASAFLEYLTGPEASQVFARAGFAPLSEESEYWEAALPEEPEAEPWPEVPQGDDWP